MPVSQSDHQYGWAFTPDTSGHLALRIPDSYDGDNSNTTRSGDDPDAGLTAQLYERVMLESLMVVSDDHQSNRGYATADGDDQPLYVEVESLADGVPILFYPTLASGNAALDQGMLSWQITGGGVRGSDLGVIGPHDGTVRDLMEPADYTVTVWVDEDSDWLLDAGEQSLSVAVTAVALGNLSVTEPDYIDNIVYDDGINAPPQMYVAEDELGWADLWLDIEAAPDGSDVNRRILWSVTGDDVFGTDRDDFATPPSVTLAPQDSHTYWIDAGFDDDADGLLDNDEISRTIQVGVVDVDLTADATKLTLMESMDLDASVLGAEAADIDLYTFQVRFDHQGEEDWLDALSTTQDNIGWTARVAGWLEHRAVVNIDGREFYSQALPTEVQFPDYANIVADAAVRDATDQLWELTLASSTVGDTREFGFWIRFDTRTGTYEFTGMVEGDIWKDPADNASISLGTRPADSHSYPSPLDQPTYTVASFHTHTPRIYSGTWPTGPSQSDADQDAADDVVGIVYDYSAPEVQGGHDPEAPARRYWSGPDAPYRRSTP